MEINNFYNISRMLAVTRSLPLDRSKTLRFHYVGSAFDGNAVRIMCDDGSLSLFKKDRI